jgi:hypothetical protein
MKKLLFVSLMLISFLNYGQSLDSMKNVHKISYTKPSENIFEKQDKLRRNIIKDVPKISKQEYHFNLDKYKGTPSLLHPDTQRLQYILNPTNARTPQQAILSGLLGWRNY